MNTKRKLSIVDFSPTRTRLTPATNPPAEKLSPAPTDKPTTILDPRFNYRSAVETDLRARFKALGFKTPKPQRPKFGK